MKHPTRAEVESVVKTWLRYAYDRSGGRIVRVGRQRDSRDDHHADNDDDDDIEN